MANEMIKFYRGLVNNLPATGTNGALYITTDEGAIYYGTGTGMKRLGDFVQVANVASLPEKAHESCLYYCVAENILAKWNGTEWKQINKQPTAEELKTLLGLGTLAYKSEVAEGDLNSDLATKINNASGAQHTHDNKGVIDGITADKVTAWDNAEQNAKDYADGLNTAMNTRVEALEAIDHEHANKALLDTYTQTEANLADAVAKKHSHTFNETELNKIVEGDVAKWNGVAADHLTSADKTTLENAIKEAKKAGTDANTNIETYKVANDARVLAVEEDIAEITDGTNGILAQAKSYSDGKLATARTEISAEIDADVKVVADELAGYKTSNDTALAGVKATAEAAATKEYTDAELAKKVNIADYDVDKATFATKTELGNVDAKFANYNTTVAQKAIDDAQDAEIAKKVDKVEGKDLISTSEIERLATLKNYDDTALAGRVTTAEGKITVLETESAKHALKTEVEAVDAKFADYTKTADLPTDLGDFTNNAGYAKTADVNTELDKKADKTQVATDIANAIAPLATTEALNGVDAKFANYTNTTDMNAKFDLKADKSVVDAMYTNAQIDGFISTEKERAMGVEAGLRTDVNTILGDYLKASDKTELEGKITAEETRAKGVEESLQTQINTIMNNPDAEGAINSINEFTQYVKDHGTIAEGFRTDIDKNKEDIAVNAKAIADQATSDAATYETKTDATAKLTEAKGYTDTEIATEKAARETKEAELAAAIESVKVDASNQDAVVLSEAQKYSDNAKAEAIADAASKYETIGTAQGIVDGLKLSETYEPIGAESRAIAAAKTETENQVKALADGQVTTNKNDIADLLAQMTWGEF